MIVECPHCYTRVWPTPQGECPACRKSIHDATDADRAKTSVSIGHRSLLPPYCCDCGRPTDRYVRIVRRVSCKADVADSPAGLLSVLALLVSWWFLPLAVMSGLRDRTGDVVIVEIPQCEVCGESGRPAPIRVNSEELRMTFVVHKDFSKQIAEQSSSPDDAATNAT